jgi:hypothetical protein
MACPIITIVTRHSAACGHEDMESNDALFEAVPESADAREGQRGLCVSRTVFEVIENKPKNENDYAFNVRNALPVTVSACLNTK